MSVQRDANTPPDGAASPTIVLQGNMYAARSVQPTSGSKCYICEETASGDNPGHTSFKCPYIKMGVPGKGGEFKPRVCGAYEKKFRKEWIATRSLADPWMVPRFVATHGDKSPNRKFSPKSFDPSHPSNGEKATGDVVVCLGPLIECGEDEEGKPIIGRRVVLKNDGSEESKQVIAAYERTGEMSEQAIRTAEPQLADKIFALHEWAIANRATQVAQNKMDKEWEKKNDLIKRLFEKSEEAIQAFLFEQPQTTGRVFHQVQSEEPPRKSTRSETQDSPNARNPRDSTSRQLDFDEATLQEMPDQELNELVLRFTNEHKIRKQEKEKKEKATKEHQETLRKAQIQLEQAMAAIDNHTNEQRRAQPRGTRASRTGR